MQWSGSRVMITGGSGSLGSALARHILAQNPARLVIFSRGEHRQQALANELASRDPAGCIRFFIGDIRDRKRLELAMRDVETVVHAAALKVVPAIEYNPFEAVATNIVGTQNVCQAAIDTGIKVVCSIGSDKQVAPINTYGATKLVAERLVVSANNYSAGRTRFVAVRYGNVAGSEGSIIPYWKAIRTAWPCGQSLPLTSIEMTRFNITMADAIRTVETAIEKGQPGQVIIPRLPSFRLVDLACAMHSQFDSASAYHMVGARPGEKMHEMLMTAEEFAAAEQVTDEFPYAVLDSAKVRAVGEECKPYASNTNTWWLGVKALQELVDEC